VTPRPIALITGATAGLGAAFARHLGAQGHDLVLIARDPVRLDAARVALEADYGVAVTTMSADLASTVGTTAAAARILAGDQAPIDVLVNNAGMGLYGTFGATDAAAEQRMLDLNVTAVLQLSHAAVQAMTARGSGLIVNVASVSGFVPRPQSVTYGAGKAWVIAFTEALSLRLAGTGVTAGVICPGFVHTEFHQRAEVDTSLVPDWMWLDADAVVTQGLADIRKGKAVSVPGVRYKALLAASRIGGRRVTRRFGSSGGPRPVR
jgi:short-subunit dehydrogenase